MLVVFIRLEIYKENSAGVEMLRYMVEELGDPEMTFDRFVRSANDYYN